jgi:hypothetical protein
MKACLTVRTGDEHERGHGHLSIGQHITGAWGSCRLGPRSCLLDRGGA